MNLICIIIIMTCENESESTLAAIDKWSVTDRDMYVVSIESGLGLGLIKE